MRPPMPRLLVLKKNLLEIFTDLFLGSLFDTVVRKAMIARTFAISGLLLLLTAYLFAAGLLTPVTPTIAWF
jgi:hypothetical protein